MLRAGLQATAAAAALMLVALATNGANAEPTELPQLSRSRDNAAAKPAAKGRASLGWDTEFGVDPYPPALPPTPPGSLAPEHSGTGWATATIPVSTLGFKEASIEVRIDPAQQSKFGATLKRPLASLGAFALSLENSYSLTRPLAATSVPGPPANPVAETWETGGAVRLDLTHTDTAFSMGTSLSSDDQDWHGKLGFEQKVLGGVSITADLSDVGTSATGASVGAEYKMKW